MTSISCPGSHKPDTRHTVAIFSSTILKGAVVACLCLSLASSHFFTTLVNIRLRVLSSQEASLRVRCPHLTCSRILNFDRPRKWANYSYRLESHCRNVLPANLLVVVPGMGNPQRIPIALQSLQNIRDSLQRTGHHGFDCLVYVYRPDVIEQVQDALGSMCAVEVSQGMWADHMKRVPQFNESTAYTHVAVLMDDVNVSNLDMVDFLYLMDWANFSVAAPSTEGDYYRSMHPRPQCLFHRTDFVNILFTVFERSAWECWHHHLDPVNNSFGWGMDVTLRATCNASLGMIDAHTASHFSDGSRLYDESKADAQMLQWISDKIGVQGNDTQRYLECATRRRPDAFEQCLVYADGTTANATTVDWEC